MCQSPVITKRHELSTTIRGHPAYYQARANGVNTADEWFKTDVEKPRTVKVMEREQVTCVTSVLNQTDGTGERSSLAKIASADLVQTNGLGLTLCSAR
jgi:hypothetical protein